MTWFHVRVVNAWIVAGLYKKPVKPVGWLDGMWRCPHLFAPCGMRDGEGCFVVAMQDEADLTTSHDSSEKIVGIPLFED